jgi:hypothetical protein
MVLTADPAPGTGFLNVLHKRQPNDLSTSAPNVDPNNSAGVARTHLTKRMVNPTVVARMTAIQAAPQAPPAQDQISFKPEPRSLTNGQMPPVNKVRRVDPDGSVRTSEAPNAVSPTSSFRYVLPNQVSKRISEPCCRVFHDPNQRISMKHKFDPDGSSEVAQLVLTGEFAYWTRTMKTFPGGKEENICTADGKPFYNMRWTRDGWTLTEPTYAIDPETGKELFHRTSVRIVTSSDGRDRLYTYNKCKLLNVQDRPITLLT